MEAKGQKTIVIAIDKFKGSLSADKAAEAISRGIVERSLSVGEKIPKIILHPMADGGEGSLDVVLCALRNMKLPVKEMVAPATSLKGGKIEVPFIIFNKETPTAFIEMAKVCGLSLISPSERDPISFTTRGLGEVIRFAIQNCGVKKVITAIGGSATNDGGEGMLQAMESIDTSRISFEVACDVRNPLIGPEGATYIYAPQKFPPDIAPEILKNSLELLEERMKKWARSVARGQWESEAARPGGGAAGGVGFAFQSVLGAKLCEGWRVFAEMVHLREHIAVADLVITGEGKFDHQSLSGKLPWGISQLCREYGKPLIAVCGQNEISPKEYQKAGFEEVFALSRIEPDSNKSMQNAEELLWHLFCTLPL